MTCFYSVQIKFVVMNGISRILIVILVHVLLVKCERIRPEVSSYTSEEDPEWERRTGRVPATVFRTVNKFYCSIDSIVEGMFEFLC